VVCVLAAVVLTKNSERTIESCLNSLLESSLLPSEVIIVDGGSSDNTLRIVEGFKEKVRIKVLFDEGKGENIKRLQIL